MKFRGDEKKVWSSFGLKQPQQALPVKHTHTLLLAHGVNYLSVCLWLPLRAALSHEQVLCGPELLPGSSVCLLQSVAAATSLRAETSFSIVLMLLTDVALFVLGDSVAFVPFYSRRGDSLKIFILTDYQSDGETRSQQFLLVPMFCFFFFPQKETQILWLVK